MGQRGLDIWQEVQMGREDQTSGRSLVGSGRPDNGQEVLVGQDQTLSRVSPNRSGRPDVWQVSY